MEEKWLETQYVTGTLSLRQLAQQHGLKEEEVRRMSRRGQWGQSRKTWRAARQGDAAPGLKMAAAALSALVAQSVMTAPEQFAGENGLDTRALKEVAGVLKDVAATVSHLTGEAQAGGAGVIEIASTEHD